MPGLRLHEAPDSYGRPFAFVSTTAGGLHAIAVEYSGDGAPAPDESVEAWVARWERVVAELRASPLQGISVMTESTRPHVLRFVLTYTDTEPSNSAASSRRRGRANVSEMAVRLGSRVPRICSLLEADAGGRAAPLSARSITYAIRAVFDPSVADMVGEIDGRPAPRWRDVAPKTVREAWDHVVHDRAASVTWVMTGVPESEPTDAFLSPAPRCANARLHVFFRQPSSPTTHHDRVATSFTASSVGATDDGVAALGELPNRLSRPVRWRLRRVFGGQVAAFAAGAGLGMAVPGQLKPPQAVGARR
ncbi:hypothetical protein LO772_01430 [Yinghuangia sp. ASG 101]|uniref:SCO6880 family protein n=1 Tax=Yinghuangia sp. ASG 101 TaxID=2896848 RepID=UPI001E49C86A|nr:SCO6880 family protein [Yinghuangia sp. ASG 101]UGQ12301.1 hypothetical protein LO772_01430 [Yinghuangia sp. ASG 101]